VTEPLAWNAGRSLASASRLVSRRGPSSVANVSSIGSPARQRAPDGAHRDGHDLVCEPPGVDRRERAVVAAQRVGVLLVARDAGFARVVLGDQPGAQVHVRILVHERGIGRDLVPAHRHEAHRLGAAGEHRAGEAAHDALGAVGDRLQPRRAEAVDRHGRRLDRQPGPQAGDAGHVQALLGFGHRAPEDHVVDLWAATAGARPSTSPRARSAASSSGPRRAERAGGRLAHRRARGGDDDGFVHGRTSVSGYVSPPPRAGAGRPTRAGGERTRARARRTPRASSPGRGVRCSPAR
jgi:hypothetical protein